VTISFKNLGKIHVTDDMVRNALRFAADSLGDEVPVDAGGNSLFAGDLIDRFRLQLDVKADAALRQKRPGWKLDPSIRADMEEYHADEGLPVGAPAFARDYDYIHREILGEIRPQLTSFKFFPTTSTVPLGFRTHKVRRSVTTGVAKWHEKADAFSVVDAGVVEEEFHTGFATIAIQRNFFEDLTNGAAGINLYREEADAAIRALDEFADNVAWYGEEDLGIWGALNYPNSARMVTNLRYGGATNPKTFIDAINMYLSIPYIRSGEVYVADRMAVPPALSRYFKTTMVDSSGGWGTLGKWLIEGQEEGGISRIEVANKLSAKELAKHPEINAPAGYDAIMIWRSDPRAVRHEMPARPTFLPIFRTNPLDTLHAAFISTGGIIMRDLGAFLLIFVRRG
jgi:hypothetical protein